MDKNYEFIAGLTVVFYIMMFSLPVAIVIRLLNSIIWLINETCNKEDKPKQGTSVKTTSTILTERETPQCDNNK